MLRFIDQFLQTPVMSLRNGRQIAKLSDPIIDPNNLSVMAFYCESRKKTGDIVLFTSDIREIGRKGVIVDSEENLMETEGLVRLEKVIEIGFVLVDKKVVTDKNDKVGKVNDYAVDDTSFKIEKLYIRPPMLKNISKGDLIVGRRQIIEVDDEKIVVKDADIRAGEKARAKAVAKPLAN